MIPVNRPLITASDLDSVGFALQETLVSGETPQVKEMERLLAQISGTSDAVAVSTGTTAIDLVVEALEIQRGDHCVVPNFTIVSTVANLLRKGAKLQFIDSDPVTWSIDASAAANAIGEETKVVLPVHIYGLPAEMETIHKAAKNYGTFILEDSAEALGLNYKDRPCGSLGDASIYSFYANKVVTGGEGGAITTSDPKFAEKLRKLRNLSHSSERFVHESLGWNARISGLSAALIASQLTRLDELIQRKKEIASKYRDGLSGHPWFEFMIERTESAENVYWVVPILLHNDAPFNAKSLQLKLKEKGVETRRFFCPMHLQPFITQYDVILEPEYKVSENLWENGIYLPSGLGNTENEIDEVINTLLGYRRIMFGETYSKIYDAIHSNKDYLSEAKQIISTFELNAENFDGQILDFGCGTGRHADQIKKLGFTIAGYDPNENMANQARFNFPLINFSSDLSAVKDKFDYVYSLFDVISYQSSDEAVLLFFNQLKSVLKPNGWILLDGWHLPGLIIDPPGARNRIFEFEGTLMSRSVTVRPIDGVRLSELEISVLQEAQNDKLFSEIHTMRAFTSQEIEEFLAKIGGTNIEFFNGGNLQLPLTVSSWRFAVKFQVP